MKQVDHILAEAAILSEVTHPFVVNMLRGFSDDHRYVRPPLPHAEHHAPQAVHPA